MRILVTASDLMLSAGAGSKWWAIAKPADLTKSHGVDITSQRLRELAASYNPEAIEAAPIKVDHVNEGPALGWIQRAEVRGDVLWIQPTALAPDLADGIRSGRYKRASMEVNLSHPVTGGWYLDGLAILGNAKPAIKGLPAISLADRPHIVRLTAANNADALAPTAATSTNRSFAMIAATDTRSPTQRAFDRAQGISDETYLELKAKHPGMFRGAAGSDDELESFTAEMVAASPEAIQARANDHLATAQKLLASADPMDKRLGEAHLELSEAIIGFFAGRCASVAQAAAAGGQPASNSVLQLAALRGIVDDRTPDRRAFDLSAGISDEDYIGLLVKYPWVRQGQQD